MQEHNGNRALAADGLAFILPGHKAFVYARRAALSFFKHTPTELRPVCLHIDDASPAYDQQDWSAFYAGLPMERIWHRHFAQPDGLTRSWNTGLTMARELGCRWAIAGNNDILFTPGWHESLLRQLSLGAQLVGPVTNCPGWANRNSQRQNIKKWLGGYQLTDDAAVLASQAAALSQLEEQLVVVDIAGFFMLSTVEAWWSGAFDDRHVFDPKHKLTENEVELQARWRKLGRRIGFCPRSLVFHYRAVARGNRHKHLGWLRLDDPEKPV